MLIYGKKFNNVHGDVIYQVIFLMHLWLSPLLILGCILLTEARPIVDLMLPRETYDDEKMSIS
jgi:hypothetical protein